MYTYNYNILTCLHGGVKTFLYVAIWYLCWPIQHWIEWKLRFWLSMLNEHAYLQKTKRRPGAWHGYNHLLANVTIDYRNLHDIAMQRTMTLKMVSGSWVVWSSVTGPFKRILTKAAAVSEKIWWYKKEHIQWRNNSRKCANCRILTKHGTVLEHSRSRNPLNVWQ